jgi:hypothetical protein
MEPSNPNAGTMAKMETVVDYFPGTMARIARLESIVATLKNVNLQLAERVAQLEGALDEAPAVAVDLGGRPALGRATSGGAVSMARR